MSSKSAEELKAVLGAALVVDAEGETGIDGARRHKSEGDDKPPKKKTKLSN